jgi:ornithine carbamoyltransferase
MANSWINAAAVFGFELTVATPRAIPPTRPCASAPARLGAKVLYTHDVMAAARGADVLNTDVWASMGQEAEQKEREKAFRGFQINQAVIVRRGAGLHRHALPAGPPR